MFIKRDHIHETQGDKAMAGMYGEIDSRKDFERVLKVALSTAKKLLAASRQADTLRPVEAQLEAMQRWSAHGRVPTDDERESIDVGLIAARELENSGDPTVDRFREELQWLNNYFEDWPSDDEAANATDDDFFEDDDDDDE
jgi:hypothetical protein